MLGEDAYLDPAPPVTHTSLTSQHRPAVITIPSSAAIDAPGRPMAVAAAMAVWPWPSAWFVAIRVVCGHPRGLWPSAWFVAMATV